MSNLEQIKANIKLQNQPRPVINADGTAPAPEGPKPLTQQEAYELAGAFARLEQLKNAPPEPVIFNAGGQESTSGDTAKLGREAEIEALVEFLANGFLNHASELLGAYFAMKNEYVPLCTALAPIVRHAQARLKANEAKISEAVKAEAANKP